jgi:hypothetical protein
VNNEYKQKSITDNNFRWTFDARDILLSRQVLSDLYRASPPKIFLVTRQNEKLHKPQSACMVARLPVESDDNLAN